MRELGREEERGGKGVWSWSLPFLYLLCFMGDVMNFHGNMMSSLIAGMSIQNGRI